MILVYRPPSSDIVCFSEIFEDVLVNVSKEYENICIFGDFNIPSINWNDDSYTSSVASNSLFCNVVNEFSLQQLNRTPSNAKGNILDLVFTNSLLQSFSLIFINILQSCQLITL